MEDPLQNKSENYFRSNGVSLGALDLPRLSLIRRSKEIWFEKSEFERFIS